MQNPDGATTFRVNPDELEGCGNSAKQVAEQIPGETTNLVKPSGAASDNLQGWATAGALRDCTNDWKALLDKFSGEMDSYGAKMIQMAQQYRAADQTVASSMQPAGSAVAGETPIGQPAATPRPPHGRPTVFG